MRSKTHKFNSRMVKIWELAVELKRFNISEMSRVANIYNPTVKFYLYTLKELGLLKVEKVLERVYFSIK